MWSRILLHTEILCHLHRSPVFVLTSYFHGEKYVGAEVLATVVMSGSTDDPFHCELKNQVMPKNLTIPHNNNSIDNVFNWNWSRKLILAWKSIQKKLPEKKQVRIKQQSWSNAHQEKALVSSNNNRRKVFNKREFVASAAKKKGKQASPEIRSRKQQDNVKVLPESCFSQVNQFVPKSALQMHRSPQLLNKSCLIFFPL